MPWSLHNKVVPSVEKLIEAVCYWSKEGMWDERISNKAPAAPEAKKFSGKGGQ